MKISMMMLSVLLAGSLPLAAEVRQNGKKSETEKLTIQGKVLQVVPEGLLLSGGSSPYLLVGHPDQKTMADGDRLNCYVNRTSETFEYVDTQGAKRTVRIYRYLSKRIGK